MVGECITYIKTYEGFLFVAVVIDLYARNIVGWSMKFWDDRRPCAECANDDLLTA